VDFGGLEYRFGRFLSFWYELKIIHSAIFKKPGFQNRDT